MKHRRLALIGLAIGIFILNGRLYGPLTLRGSIGDAIATLGGISFAAWDAFHSVTESAKRVIGRPIEKALPKTIPADLARSLNLRGHESLLIVRLERLDSEPAWFYVNRSSPRGIREKCVFRDGQVEQCPAQVIAITPDWRNRPEFSFLVEEVSGQGARFGFRLLRRGAEVRSRKLFVGAWVCPPPDRCGCTRSHQKKGQWPHPLDIWRTNPFNVIMK